VTRRSTGFPNPPGTETIANRHSRSTASPSPPRLLSSPRWIRPETSLRDRHARLSHGSVNGSPSTAATETKTRNCRLGRGASARARHCCAGRRSASGTSWSEGWRRGWHDPPTVGFFDPPIEPTRERRQQLAPFHPQDRIANDAFSLIGICDCVQHRCLEGSEQGTSLNSRHHPEQAIDGWRPPSSEVAALVNAWKHRYITWPASRHGRRLRSPGSPFVTPGGANTWSYPAPGGQIDLEVSVW
jgi:hypothetical protein